MLHLSLIELNSAKTSKKSESSLTYLNSDGHFDFISAATFDKHNCNNEETSVSDVTKKIFKGKYGLNNKYTILFLYDFFEDGISRDFIATYGGKLHNSSSLNISVLTYFTSMMVKGWENVQFREEINCFGDEDAYQVINLIKHLQEAYKVPTLPAIVLIKKGNNEKEESLNIDMSSYKKKEDMYAVFKELFEKINDNCEEDFSVIARKILGYEAKISKEPTMSCFNTCNYVADLVKQERNYNMIDLAIDLGISERTLRNKRNDDSFTRNECLFIAIRFGIDIKDLNELLRVNNHHELALEGRDGIVRRCLFDGDDIYQADRMLKEKGYKGIIKNNF